MARLTASQRRKKQAEIRTNRKPLVTKGAGKGQGNKGRVTGRAKGTVLAGGGTKKSTTKKKTKHESPYKTIEQRNRETFGDKHIDALKIKTAAWKKARKEGTLKEWEKKYKPKQKRRMGVDPSEY